MHWRNPAHSLKDSAVPVQLLCLPISVSLFLIFSRLLMHVGLLRLHGRPHLGANTVSWPPGKMDRKLKSENMQKRRAIRAGRCRERRYADHIFIQIYFRIHHFVVKFLIFYSPQAARGHWPPIQNPADALVCLCVKGGQHWSANAFSGSLTLYHFIVKVLFCYVIGK